MHRLLLLCCALAWLSAGEAPDPAAAYQQAVDDAHGTYQQAVETAGKAYGASVGKAREACVTALAGIARRESRKDDRSGATAAWTEVLRLRPDHPDANAYVDLLPREQGEAIRAALGAQPASAGDLLGDTPGTPAAHPATTADVARYRDIEARERAAFAKVEAAARSRFLDAEGKAKAKALAALGTMAERAVRAGDLPVAAGIWKQALTLQRDHPPAIAFFDRIGTTAETLASLPEAVDPLGPPPDPAGFVEGGGTTPGAPASLRGVKIAIVGSADSVLHATISDRLTKAGAVVTAIDHGKMMDYGSQRSPPIAELDNAQLVLCLDLSDASRGGFANFMRDTRVPIVSTEHSPFAHLGLSGRVGWGMWLRTVGGNLEAQAGVRHPILTGLPPAFPFLLPPKPGAKDPSPADTEGLSVSFGFPLPEGGGVSLVAPAGKPNFHAVVAFESGLPMPGPVHAPPAGAPRPPVDAAKIPKSPARRVAFMVFADGALDRDPALAQRLTPQVWKLWDASLVWARGR